MMSLAETLTHPIQRAKYSEYLFSVKQRILKRIRGQQELGFVGFNSELIQHYFPEHLEEFPIVSAEPKQVRQLKKVLSVLDKFRLIFQDLERNSLSLLDMGIDFYAPEWLNYLKSYFVSSRKEPLYDAFKLLFVDKELEFTQEFSQELDEISTLIDLFKDFSSTTPQDIGESSVQPEQIITLAFQAGYSMSHGLFNTHDVAALSQAPLSLARMIEKLNEAIHHRNTSVPQHTPVLSPVQVLKMHKQAKQSLINMQNTLNSQPNSLAYHYNFMLSSLDFAKIFAPILGQLTELNKSWLGLLRDHLSLIKRQTIPLLWSYAVHMEIEFLLKPGTLTQPLLKKLNDYYVLMISYLKNTADLKHLGPTFGCIEDFSFLNDCELILQTKMHDSKQKLQHLEWARRAATKFFNPNSSMPFSLWKVDYAYFAGYVQQINPQLNQQIIQSLRAAQPGFDWLSALPKLQKQLSSHFNQLKKTEDLRQKQIQALLNHLQDHQHFRLFPLSPKEEAVYKASVFQLLPPDFSAQPAELVKMTVKQITKLGLIRDEAESLSVNEAPNRPNEVDPFALPAEALLSFKRYYWYKQKITESDRACVLLEDFNGHVLVEGAELEQFQFFKYSYHVIRPYLIEHKDFFDMDHKMVTVDALLAELSLGQQSDEDAAVKTAEAIQLFKQVKLTLQEISLFNENHINVLVHWRAQAKISLHEAKVSIKNAHFSALFSADLPCFSSAYPNVFKMDVLLAKIKDLKCSLLNWKSYLHPEIRGKLMPSESIPFPDIGPGNSSAMIKNKLQETAPVLFFKQISNAFYHLEVLVNGLNQLPDDHGDPEIKIKNLDLVFNLCLEHVRPLSLLFTELSKKKPWAEFFDETWIEFREFRQKLAQFYRPYTENISVASLRNENIQYPSLWYLMNFLHVFPAHFHGLASDALSAGRDIAKTATQEVQKVYHDYAASYFKLIAEDTALISKLYGGLLQQQRALFFASLPSSEEVMPLLLKMEEDYLLPILLNADLKEHQLCLAPGTLSDPLEKIIQDWRQGWIMGLPSKNFSEIKTLVSDPKFFDLRIDALEQQLNDLENNTTWSDSGLTEIAAFVCQLTTFRSSINPYLSFLMSIPTPLSQHYCEVKDLVLSPYQDSLLPVWLQGLPESLSMASISKVIEGLEHYLAFIKGDEAEQALEMTLLRTKKEHILTQKLMMQQRIAEEYRHSYLKFYCYTRLDDAQLGLSHYPIEQAYKVACQEALKQALSSCLDEIPLLNDADVDAYVKDYFEKTTTNFKRDNIKIYQQLDQIYLAMMTFKTYVQQSHSHDLALQSQKIRALEQLDNIINSTAAPQDKINRLKAAFAESRPLLSIRPEYQRCFFWILDCLAQWVQFCLMFILSFGQYKTPLASQEQALAEAINPPSSEPNLSWSHFFWEKIPVLTKELHAKQPISGFYLSAL